MQTAHFRIRRPRLSSLGLAVFKIALVLVACFAVARVVQGTVASARWYGQAAYERWTDLDFAQTTSEDYVAFYAAGKMVREGRGGDLYDIDAIGAEERDLMGRGVGGTGRLAYFNPPFLALLIAPLTFLPLDVAALVGCAFVLLVVLICAIGGPPFLGLRRWEWLGGSTAILLAAPTFTVVIQPQTTAFVIGSWVMFAGFLQRGRSRRAGASLIIGLVKPHLVVFGLFYLIWRRQWDGVLAFIVGAGVLGIVSVAVSGPSVLYGYPIALHESMSWQAADGVTPMHMANWLGYFTRTLGFERAGTASVVASLVTLAGVSGAVACSRFKEDVKPVCALLVAASLLVSGHTLFQDTLLMVFCVWALSDSLPARLWWAALIGVTLAFTLPYEWRSVAVVWLVLGLVEVIAVRPGEPRVVLPTNRLAKPGASSSDSRLDVSLSGS